MKNEQFSALCAAHILNSLRDKPVGQIVLEPDQVSRAVIYQHLDTDFGDALRNQQEVTKATARSVSMLEDAGFIRTSKKGGGRAIAVGLTEYGQDLMGFRNKVLIKACYANKITKSISESDVAGTVKLIGIMMDLSKSDREAA